MGDRSLMLCHHHQVPELGLVSANTLSTVQVVSRLCNARESRISEPSVGSKHAGGAALDWTGAGPADGSLSGAAHTSVWACK